MLFATNSVFAPYRRVSSQPYQPVGARLALLYMAPNRFTGKIISLWGSRVLCSPTDAKKKRAILIFDSLSTGSETVKLCLTVADLTQGHGG